MTEQELLSASEEDQQFFFKCVQGLPLVSADGMDSNGQPMPYFLGAHSVRCLRRIVELVEPKSILEIGFNVGVSSSLWLNLSSASVVSVDISDRQETLTAAKKLSDDYPDRFDFILSDSAKLFGNPQLEGLKFDLIFIDGGHLEHDVLADIKLALDLGIKYLAFDDYLPKYGPGVQPAIEKHGLTMIEEMGNIVLMRV
jgi:hypothetical protein